MSPANHNRPRIVIVSGYPVSQTPRVIKEADALAKLDFDVHVIGATYSEAQRQIIARRIEGKKWTHHDSLNAAGTASQKIQWQRGRVYRKTLQKLKIAPRKAFQYRLHNDIPGLTRLALDLEADFYSLHMEPAMFVADAIIEKGIPFSFDFEDWHSRNNVHGDAPQPYTWLAEQERKIFESCQFSTTTSEALSQGFMEAYGARPSTVIFNSFPDSDYSGSTTQEFPSDRPRIVWFSQTVGPGRGLEILVDAVRRMKEPAEIHIRGNVSDDYRAELLARSPEIRERIQILPPCEHHELDPWLRQHDVGFASEITHCPNRDLTITNKILQYMQAGLAVLATDTKGQREVAATSPESVELVETSVASIAAKLDEMIVDRNDLARRKRLARQHFDESFAWEASERKLQEVFERYASEPAKVPCGESI